VRVIDRPLAAGGYSVGGAGYASSAAVASGVLRNALPAIFPRFGKETGRPNAGHPSGDVRSEPRDREAASVNKPRRPDVAPRRWGATSFRTAPRPTEAAEAGSSWESKGVRTLRAPHARASAVIALPGLMGPHQRFSRPLSQRGRSLLPAALSPPVPAGRAGAAKHPQTRAAKRDSLPSVVSWRFGRRGFPSRRSRFETRRPL
jgi:hypothetical protein